MYKYMGSRCPLKKTPLKHPGEVLIVGFRALRLKAWDFFSPPVEIEPFSPYCFLFLLCFVKTACNLGKTTENASHVHLERTGPRGWHLVRDFSSRGDDTVNRGPSAYA